MRRRVYLIGVLAGIWAGSFALSHAEPTPTNQQEYLNIYLKINDAEHLEKQGDFRGALEDFKDCYARLAKIHKRDPNWESALVLHRMDDCKAKILDLEPKAAAQAPPNPPSPPPSLNVTQPASPEANPNNAISTPNVPDDVDSLKKRLQQVEDELRVTKDNLKDSQIQVDTYRTQLETVNAQLAAVKNGQSVDDRMGKLLSENKDLTDKLAAAQKQIDDFKSNPKSKLALAQAQLKKLQDQYDASQEANKALQLTVTTLQQKLDQASNDLNAANQKLATAGPSTPEYETLKRENEVMRDILTRELQEQAHRDMAKRLAQEEFDNLKLKSKVLQEQLDILGSPMTPPTNDQERALLASLKVSGQDVTQPPTTGASFSAPATGSTNVASATPPASTPATTPTPSTPDTSTPPVTVVSNNPTTTTPDTTTPATTTPSTPTTPTTDPSTNSSTTTPAPTTTPDTSTPPTPPTPPAPTTPDGTTPISPSGAPAPDTTPSTSTPATDPNAPTKSVLPPATTTVTDTTITKPADTPQTDPSQYAQRARLPDDMRDTAQQAADLFKNQRYDDAAMKYQSIIDKYPESLYAWSNLGVVRFQQGKLEEALKALQQAVKLSPTDAFSYSNLGIVYYQLGQYENAIDALNSAKALDPNDAKTHNYLGCACSQKGWQEVAEKEFRKAIELDPNFGDAHFNLALVYATSKPPSLELARREYNRAVELGIAKDPRLEKLLKVPAQQ